MVIYTILLGSVPASFETSVPNYRRVSTGPRIWVLRACCNPHSLLLLFPVPSPDVQVWTSLALWFYFFLLSPLSELAFSVLICGIISLSSSCAGCLDVSRQLLPLPVFFFLSPLLQCSVAFLHLPDCLSAFYLGAGAPGAVILCDSTERFALPLRLDNYQIPSHVDFPAKPPPLPSCQRRSHLGNMFHLFICLFVLLFLKREPWESLEVALLDLPIGEHMKVTNKAVGHTQAEGIGHLQYWILWGKVKGVIAHRGNLLVTPRPILGVFQNKFIIVQRLLSCCLVSGPSTNSV